MHVKLFFSEFYQVKAQILFLFCFLRTNVASEDYFVSPLHNTVFVERLFNFTLEWFLRLFSSSPTKLVQLWEKVLYTLLQLQQWQRFL